MDKVRVTTEVSITDICPECECAQLIPMADCLNPDCECHVIERGTLDATNENMDYAGEE